MCLFIIMSISVKRHELWCTFRDMRFGKCSITIIIFIICEQPTFFEKLTNGLRDCNIYQPSLYLTRIYSILIINRCLLMLCETTLRVINVMYFLCLCLG